MLISVVNHTQGQVADSELQCALRAINRQIAEDFEPYWSIGGRLRLEGRSARRPETLELVDLRGDAIIYLWSGSDVDDALGYHRQNARGIPYGFVFTEISKRLKEPWSIALSHEALELLGDPETNLVVMGPHPSRGHDVFHWFEMCDAVQAESYELDGVSVSNFVLPLYFTGTRRVDEVGARNDFLGRSHRGRALRSFSINPGGYIGFYDPVLGMADTYVIEGDRDAAIRQAIKADATKTRRAMRYRRFEGCMRPGAFAPRDGPPVVGVEHARATPPRWPSSSAPRAPLAR